MTNSKIKSWNDVSDATYPTLAIVKRYVRYRQELASAQASLARLHSDYPDIAHHACVMLEDEASGYEFKAAEARKVMRDIS